MDEATAIEAELIQRELNRRELSRRGGASPDVAQQSGRFGAMTKTPSVIERIGTNLTAPETKPLGVAGGLGVALSAAGIPEENILPAIGQGVGGMASGFTGAGTLGATGGSVVGEVAKEAIKGTVRGGQSDFSGIPRHAATTAVLEGLTRGVGGRFFKKQLANKELGELGKKLGGMKEELSKTDTFIPSGDFVQRLESTYNSLPAPVRGGKQGKAIREWIKYGRSTPYFSAKDMILMEENLGNVADFGVMKKGVFQPATDIPNPALNTLAKGARKNASDTVEGLSQKAGQKDFGKISARISHILKRWPDLDPSKSYGSFGSRMVTSGMAGMMTGSPLVGAGTYLAEKTLQSPEFRNKAFEVVQNPVSRTVGTGSKLLLSELARRKDKKK